MLFLQPKIHFPSLKSFQSFWSQVEKSTFSKIKDKTLRFTFLFLIKMPTHKPPSPRKSEMSDFSLDCKTMKVENDWILSSLVFSISRTRLVSSEKVVSNIFWKSS